MNVLVPYDGSEYAKEALLHAVDTYPDARLHVLHVIDPVYRGGEKQPKAAWWNMWYEDREKRAQTLLDEAREMLDDHGRDVTTEHRTGKPSEEILLSIQENDIDVVVMGRQGESGLSRLLLGSSAKRVARHADIPVTLVGETSR
ncbi:MAG: universal stress protein [Halobacteriales archaeon]